MKLAALFQLVREWDCGTGQKGEKISNWFIANRLWGGVFDGAFVTFYPDQCWMLKIGKRNVGDRNLTWSAELR